MTNSLPEAMLKRDRIVVLSSVAGIAALAWLALLPLARGMNDKAMDATMTMPQVQAWSSADVASVFAMWVVMMVAMMTPSVVPTLMLFASINRSRREQASPFTRTWVFLLGYLGVWAGFAALATLAQWGLNSAALLSPLTGLKSPLIGGAILAAAGTFQWSSLKHACLSQCRSPQGFFMTEWREGERGALVMGFKHGTFCLGCCWLLMGLLFVIGAMNILWMVVLALFILVEKVTPAGIWVSRAAGLLLIGSGAWMAAGAFT